MSLDVADSNDLVAEQIVAEVMPTQVRKARTTRKTKTTSVK